MSIIHFPYQRISGRLEPVIPIGVKLGKFWRPLNFYVDSGATYSVIHAKIAQETGLDYLQGRRINLRVGDGRLILIYLNLLELQLGNERFTCQVGISSQLGTNFNILGRIDVFSRFKVCFAEYQNRLTFEYFML